MPDQRSLSDQLLVAQESKVQHVRDLVERARREADLRGCASAAEFCKQAQAVLDVMFSPSAGPRKREKTKTPEA